VDALDDAFLWDIVETCEEHFGISRFFAPDNWSFDENSTEPSLNRRRTGGGNYLIQSINERNMLRKSAYSDGSSAESNCSGDTVGLPTCSFQCFLVLNQKRDVRRSEFAC
jgi:hypothetical protein